MSTQAGLDRKGEWLAFAKGHAVELVPVANMEGATPLLVGLHNAEIVELGFHPDDERVVAADRSGEIRVWSRTAPTPNQPLRILKIPSGYAYGAHGFDRAGRWLAAPQGEFPTWVWDLAGPPDVEPVKLELPGNQLCAAFHPDGEWIAVAKGDGTTLWPLSRAYCKVIGAAQFVNHAEFGADGSWLASASDDGALRLWSLESGAPEETRVVGQWDDGLWNVVVDPESRFLVTAGHVGVLRMVGLHDGAEKELPTPPSPAVASGMDVDSSGRYLAVGFRWSEDRDEHVTRVYDLEAGEFYKLDAGDGEGIGAVRFLRDGRLLVSSGGNLRLWDVESQTHKLLMQTGGFALSRDERRLLSVRQGRVVFHDLENKLSRELTSHGNRVWCVAFDATGELAVTGDEDGVVRVGPVTGEEPHLLLGHKGVIFSLEVHPNGRWIASASGDESEGAIRLWPMPEGTPLHTLPYDEFLARLRKLTNVRVVRDDAAPDGYSIDYARFPGWEEVPTW
jgi:WD40 repeat protein